MEKLGQLGGTGGIVALDRSGAIAMPFNTEGMYRGYIDTDGTMNILIYGLDEE
jgi:beta-aspartyl-peptidase (threonine type)